MNWSTDSLEGWFEEMSPGIWTFCQNLRYCTVKHEFNMNSGSLTKSKSIKMPLFFTPGWCQIMQFVNIVGLWIIDVKSVSGRKKKDKDDKKIYRNMVFIYSTIWVINMYKKDFPNSLHPVDSVYTVSSWRGLPLVHDALFVMHFHAHQFAINQNNGLNF